jgi:hypothetical protein
MKEMNVNAKTLVRRRSFAQGLASRRFESEVDVLEWMLAMQSQERAVAPWSLGQRTRDRKESDVLRAIADGRIIRTHVLRPTWHYVRAADARWLLEFSAPRVHAANRHYYGTTGLDDETLVRGVDGLAQLLEGKQHRTRVEIAAELRQRGEAWEGFRLGYLLMYAELERVICSGAPKGKHQTYALFDERVGVGETLSRDEALARFTLAYFRSRGPATVKDFCAWATLTVAEATRGLAIVASELERVDVDGRTYWFCESGEARSRSSRTAHFLQGYDEYFMSYRESRDLARPKTSASATSGEQVPFIHAAILHGQVVARWRRKVHRDHVQLETRALTRVTSSGRDALARAAREYARFVGVPVELTMDGD